jgi:regulator of RNase E activity RraA
VREGPRRPQQHRGVAVKPDDILFGNDDGIMVATAQDLVEAIPVAEAIQSEEETALSRMREGASLTALGAGGFPDYQT